MELVNWANGKGYTLMADDPEEFDRLYAVLDQIRYYGREIEVDETVSLEELGEG